MPRIVTVSKRTSRSRPSHNFLICGIALVGVCVVVAVFFLNSKDTPAPCQMSSAALNSDTEVPLKEQPVISDSIQISDVAIPASTNYLAEVVSLDNVPRTNSVLLARQLRRERELQGYNGGSLEELVVSMLKGAQGGGIPPTPMGSEEEIRAALMNAITNDIVIYKDDDEKTVAMKESVADVKQQLQQILESGGSVKKALAEYVEWANNRLKRRGEVTAEYVRLKKEESQEAANEYLLEANKQLEAEGIDPLLPRVPTPRRRPHHNPN